MLFSFLQMTHLPADGVSKVGWSLPGIASATWDQWGAKAASLGSECLFFIGATYLTVLLLKAGRRVYAALAFSLGLLWLAFHLPVSLYLESLGVDSFAETNQFDLGEASFWLQTLGEAIKPVFSFKKFAIYLVLALVSFYVLKKVLHGRLLSPRAYFVTKVLLSVALMAVAVQMTISSALASYMGNSEVFLTAAKNFTNPAPEVTAAKERMQLIVYIGESTSAMNMALYGYSRPTTPVLSDLAAKDDNLIVFRNVFSTHTHTSGSLMDALSLRLRNDQDFLPINDRKRVSIVDVLHKGGFETRLFSNQVLDGSWSNVSSVIFKHSDNVFRGTRREVAGIHGSRWDDEFFERQLDALEHEPAAERRAVFLHSYAAHGRYYANIPERFRQPVDRSLAQLSHAQVVDDPAQSVEAVEEYDAAIKYVDYSVGKIIGRVRQSPQPTIFVYFSDHGDAAFAGRGHDSARFKHEMARVPFVMYFNDAARSANPALYAKYRALANAHNIATLAQLSPTLMDLVGIGFKDPARSAVSLTPVVGQSTRLPPIVVRETGEGITFVNINDVPLVPPSDPKHKFIDKTDPDTRNFVAIHSGRVSRGEFCRVAAHESLEDRSRSIVVGDCPRAASDARVAQ